MIAKLAAARFAALSNHLRELHRSRVEWTALYIEWSRLECFEEVAIAKRYVEDTRLGIEQAGRRADFWLRLAHPHTKRAA